MLTFTDAYHQFVDRLPILVFGPLAVAAVLLVIVVGIRRAITSFRSRPTADQLKAAYEAYLQRLLNPQPNAIEGELGNFSPKDFCSCTKTKPPFKPPVSNSRS